MSAGASGAAGARPRILVITTWYPTPENPSTGSFVEDDVTTLSEFADVRVLHLDPHGTAVRRSARVGAAPVLSLPLRWTDPLSMGRAIRTIRRHAVRFDLLHTMAFPALLLTRAAACAGTPWLHTEHFSTIAGHDPSLRDRAVRGLARTAYAGPDRIVAVSSLLGTRIEVLSGRDDVTVIGNHVTEAGALPDRRVSAPVRVVGIGGLIEGKNPLLVVDALAEFAAHTPVELTWYGDGPLRDEMLERAGERGVKVRLPGAVPRADVLAGLGAADVFFVPTRGETFFLGAAESAAHGLPVLTSDVGAQVEFLDPRYAEMLPADAPPRRWADGLRDLLKRTRTVAPSTIAATMERFSRPVLAERYRDVILALLEGHLGPERRNDPHGPGPAPEFLVFHAPYAIELNGSRGSAIRPRKMLEALGSLGIDVLEITGDSRARATGLRELRGRLAAGHRARAAYFENASIPTLIADPDHLPHRPDVDPRILHTLHRHGVPVGYFYRDVYWRFGRYVDSVGLPMALAMRLLYRAELLMLRRGVDVMFLPSLRMGEHVPHFPVERFAALPPGAEGRPLPLPTGPFTVLYVGGVGEYYRIHALLEAARDTEGVHVIICTREGEWTAHRDDYAALLTDRVEVVHASGEGLRQLYTRAHVCSLVMAPDRYRDFAAPVKLYEYIGYGRPILCTESTHAADVVEAFGCGAIVEYEAESIGAVLRRLRDHRGALEELAARARDAAGENTWTARAREMLEVLEQGTQEETA